MNVRMVGKTYTQIDTIVNIELKFSESAFLSPIFRNLSRVEVAVI